MGFDGPLIFMELLTKRMPLVPKSHPSRRVLKTGTQNRSEEILGDIVAAPLQLVLDGLVSNRYYAAKTVKVTGQMVSSNFLSKEF